MHEQIIRNREALIEWIRGGGHPKYLFFWGHKAKRDGEVGKPIFSQWWPAAFDVDGVTYPTAEHFMMAAKARLFGDEAALSQILVASDPAVAKHLGRKVRGFDEGQWNEARFEIVVRANRAKFSQHSELRTFLLNTQKRVLVEASPVDRVWGIGMAADDPRAEDPEQWLGLNLLGFALMEVRYLLQQKSG